MQGFVCKLKGKLTCIFPTYYFYVGFVLIQKNVFHFEISKENQVKLFGYFASGEDSFS